MWESIHELKMGLGNLLVYGERQHSGIALLHSRASGHAEQIDRSMCDVRTSQVHFQAIIEDLGMQYNYVSSLDIKEGILDTGEYRVLVLPYCQAISDHEARQIRRFVENGGVIIADLRPGIFNRFCRRLKQGQLDALFGIKRVDIARYRVEGELTGDEDLAVGLKVPSVFADASVRVAGGRALAHVRNTPCLVVNRVKKRQGHLA